LIFNTQFPYLWCTSPDHDRQASGRLKLNPQFPYQMHARPDDGRLASGRLYLNCDSCLMYERVRTGIHVVRTVASIFPYLTWKENLKLIDHWTSSRRATETPRRMQAGTEASRCSEGSGQKSTSFGRMMLGLSKRPYGMALLPDGWNSGQMSVRTGWHDCPDN